MPSELWYTPDGRLHSVGVRRPSLQADEDDEDDRMICAQWYVSCFGIFHLTLHFNRFKFWLRPNTLPSDGLVTAELIPLPPGKNIVHVLGDFLKYLYDCAKKHINETHWGGDTDVWDTLADQIEFVLSHPNGWGGSQQRKMRSAAIHAGLVPDTSDGHDRIHFVTEGEASLLYCIDSGLAADLIRVSLSNRNLSVVGLNIYNKLAARYRNDH